MSSGIADDSAQNGIAGVEWVKNTLQIVAGVII
jgi:hypothetical protein